MDIKCLKIILLTIITVEIGNVECAAAIEQVAVTFYWVSSDDLLRPTPLTMASTHLATDGKLCELDGQEINPKDLVEAMNSYLKEHMCMKIVIFLDENFESRAKMGDFISILTRMKKAAKESMEELKDRRCVIFIASNHEFLF